ncbi:MAG TPA: hypothetical protein VGF77_17145 [Allosphingosinicella sp.]|jgi:hypothetical protein
MDALQPQGRNKGGAESLVALDIMSVLVCVMIVALLAMAVIRRGDGHEAGGIAALTASLAALFSTRQQLARRARPLDADARARRQKRTIVALLVALACAVAGAASVFLFHLG